MHDYTQLQVWIDSCSLAVRSYEITSHFPREERYGLVAQIRRSAVSIPSNIAEGSGRESAKDFERFLRISLGSAYELDTQLYLAWRIGYLDEVSASAVRGDLRKIRAMIVGLQRAIA